jgi:hypothetical protein
MRPYAATERHISMDGGVQEWLLWNRASGEYHLESFSPNPQAPFLQEPIWRRSTTTEGQAIDWCRLHSVSRDELAEFPNDFVVKVFPSWMRKTQIWTTFDEAMAETEGKSK